MFLLLGDANPRDPVVPRASAVPAFSWEGPRLSFRRALFIIILARPVGFRPLSEWDVLAIARVVPGCFVYRTTVRLATGSWVRVSATDHARSSNGCRVPSYGVLTTVVLTLHFHIAVQSTLQYAV